MKWLAIVDSADCLLMKSEFMNGMREVKMPVSKTMLTFFEGEAFSDTGSRESRLRSSRFAALAAFSSGHSPSPKPFRFGFRSSARAFRERLGLLQW